MFQRFFLSTVLVMGGACYSVNAAGQSVDNLSISDRSARYLERKDFIRYMEKNRDQDAIRLLDDLLSEDDIGDQERATLLLLKAMLINPENPEARKNAARLLETADNLNFYNPNLSAYQSHLNAPESPTDNAFEGTLNSRAGAINRPAIPLVRMPGRVPEQALAEGRSGHCKLQFTVKADGSTKDIRAFFCTHRMFEANSIEAVSNFKYRPKVVNNQPVETLGVETKVSYQVTDENGIVHPE